MKKIVCDITDDQYALAEKYADANACSVAQVCGYELGQWLVRHRDKINRAHMKERDRMWRNAREDYRQMKEEAN